MTSHRFESAFARIRRAEKHLVDLKQALAVLTKEQEYTAVAQIDPQATDGLKKVRLRMRKNAPVPYVIGALVGEICYNLRSSLDYFIFELAILDSGKRQARTQFPFEFDPQKFPCRAKIYLRGINAGHVAMIERLQPYNECAWARRLVGLSNQDKHREFTDLSGRFIVKAVQAPPGGVNVQIAVKIEILLKDGAPIVETLEEIKAGVAETLVAFKSDFER